jgi:hypothetical protein
MAKIVLSSNEFKCLTSEYQGKEALQVRWRDFSDKVDEVFTKKGMEKDHSLQVDDVRTQSFYGCAQPASADNDNVACL